MFFCFLQKRLSCFARFAYSRFPRFRVFPFSCFRVFGVFALIFLFSSFRVFRALCLIPAFSPLRIFECVSACCAKPFSRWNQNFRVRYIVPKPWKSKGGFTNSRLWKDSFLRVSCKDGYSRLKDLNTCIPTMLFTRRSESISFSK